MVQSRKKEIINCQKNFKFDFQLISVLNSLYNPEIFSKACVGVTLGDKRSGVVWSTRRKQ